MGKRLLLLAMVALAGFAFISSGVLTAADLPDDIMIENEGYTADKKGAVKLSHKKHNEKYKATCIDCHHEYEEGKNVWKQGDPVKKCSECHNPLQKEGDVMKLQNAYHKNCKNCHKAKNDQGELLHPNAPFKKCNDCHAKKSK